MFLINRESSRAILQTRLTAFKMYYVSSLSFVFIFKYVCSEHLDFHEDFTGLQSQDWMVRITKGIEVARTIAQNEGFVVIDEIPNMKLYRFSKSNSHHEIDDEIHARLSKYDEISWLEPIKLMIETHGQLKSIVIDRSIEEYEMDHTIERLVTDPKFMTHSEIRSLDDIVDAKLRDKPKVLCAGPLNEAIKTDMPLSYNDPLYPKQWFMRGCKEVVEHLPSYFDIKLTQTRQDFNLYGDGVRIIVVDDGVITNHKDLAVDLDFSYNFFRKIRNPSPHSFEESHGTYCAGIIGMKEDNGVCGVGMAPHATIGGLKMLSPKTPVDIWISIESLQFKASEIDIISRSLYSPEIYSFSLIDDAINTALHTGITEGRHGKGILYFFPAANEKKASHTCSTRNMENSIYTITIAGVNHDGRVSDYSERCAAVMAAVYSGRGQPYAIPTIDASGGTKCFENFNGTSASVPMAAGLLALVIQANPNLTWREVQHLIAWTSEIATLTQNPGWTENAAGFYVSLDFGFGLLNVYDMVEMAMNFQPVGPMHTCSTGYKFKNEESSFNLMNPLSIKLLTDGCKGTATEVSYIEHVELTITIQYEVRGDLQIRLMSPSKTKVHILEPRPYDGSSHVIQNYPFQSVHTWGENPQGDWTVHFFDDNGNEDKKGRISYVGLTFYGTKTQPNHYKNGKRKYLPFTFPRS